MQRDRYLKTIIPEEENPFRTKKTTELMFMKAENERMNRFNISQSVTTGADSSLMQPSYHTVSSSGTGAEKPPVGRRGAINKVR